MITLRHAAKRHLRAVLRDVTGPALSQEQIADLRSRYRAGGFSERVLITRRLQAEGVSGRIVDYIRGRGPLPAPAQDPDPPPAG